MKKTLLLLLVFVLACAALFVPTAAMASDYVLFTGYNVKINVQDNNVLDVTEYITANFDANSLKHGITRKIPVKLEMNTPEGVKNYNVIVSDIQVPGQKYKVSRDGDYLNIRIGDAGSFVSGKVEYTIRYKYDIGDDKVKAQDVVNYNIIGTEWNADIQNASFTVTMPKEFDKSKVYVYVGKRGETAKDADVTVNGNVINGKITRALTPGEGVTLLVDLPEGYFTGVRTMPAAEVGLFIFMGLLVILSIILFVMYGIDKKVIPTVEFYAPDKLTPAEVGYIIDGCVDNKDVVSLIIYWADKGYIHINEKEKDNIILQKIKDLPPEAERFETALFYGIFKGGELVSVKSLNNNFYTTMQAVKADLKASFQTDKKRIFTAVSMRMQGLMSFFTALPFVATLFYAAYSDSMEFMPSCIIAAVALFIMLPTVYALVSLLRSWRSTPHNKRVGKLIWRIILIALVFLIYLFFMTGVYDLNLLATAAILATVVIAWISVFIRKRTDQGNEWYGKVIGLSDFIEKAEKPRIEMLVNENPSYFYNILPYAYVLGVTEKWAKKFEDIGLKPEPPTWYSGYYGMNMFTTMMFMNSINHSMNTISSTMVSQPAPKGGYGGGGGFGGGGFSGGGFGGGGGGSW